MKDNFADACIKLLDNGWNVILFKNGLGTYSAVATRRPIPERVIERGVITDRIEPSAALYALTEKALFGRIVATKREETGDA